MDYNADVTFDRTILDGFRRDLEKDNIEISVLEKKQSDLHSQEQEATAAIDEATRILELQKGSGATDLANFEGSYTTQSFGIRTNIA